MVRFTAAGVALALAAAVAGATPGQAALANVSLVASNNQVSAAGVTLTLTFQVGALDKGLAVILPSGFSGLTAAGTSVTTSADGTTFTAPSLSGSKLLSTDAHSVAVNVSSALAVGTWVKVVITGLTNPATVGNQTITIGGKALDLTQADIDGALATLLALLAETANTVLGLVAVVTSGITNAVHVAPALTFAASAASHSWNLDPSGTASSTAISDTLTVATNAVGYVIQATISGDAVRAGTTGAAAADMIPAAGSLSGPHFGYRVTGPGSDTVDSTAFHTFSAAPANLVSGWTLSGLTNGESTTVTYDVATDYTRSAGEYLATVTYRVVPTY